MRKRIKRSLYSMLVGMTVIPMITLGIIIAVFCSYKFITSVHDEVASGLKNMTGILLNIYDRLYPGDYVLAGNDEKVLMKGNHIISGDYGIVDEIKETTGIDVTVFYFDTRILTTICDKDGNRIVGTTINDTVMKDVYDGRKSMFYDKVIVNGEYYFAYYSPLYNSDGSCIGMVFAGKPSRKVEAAILHSIFPFMVIILASTIAAGVFSILLTKQIVHYIKSIQNFLSGMAQGNLTASLNPGILQREDELGKMGRAVIKMQRSLRDLIEKDVLTGLNNRRYGNEKLAQIQNQAAVNGTPFSVVLGDIDFFKRVNDTYGHEGGDQVLKEIARILNERLTGKGFACRWGGEEFLLVYNRFHAEETGGYVCELLQDIRDMEIIYKGSAITVTMTFGVAEGSTDMKIDELVKKADDKLYFGKTNGRNRVIV